MFKEACITAEFGMASSTCLPISSVRGLGTTLGRPCGRLQYKSVTFRAYCGVLETSKKDLLTLCSTTNRGKSAPAAQQLEILQKAKSLESLNPTKDPGWVETTYLDEDLRIGRGDKGSIFNYCTSEDV
eukprot:jgi/Botrbrau1/542/Bobra.0010s0017.1